MTTQNSLPVRFLCVVALAAIAVLPLPLRKAQAHGNSGVTLVTNATFGANVAYTDVYYHKGLAFIGTLSTPAKLYIADPNLGTLVGVHNTSNGSWVKDMQAQGNYLYVALDQAGLDIVDISVPSTPVLVRRFNTTSSGVHDLFVHGDTLYYVDDVLSSSLHIVNIRDRSNPVPLATYTVSGGCHDLTIVGHRAFLANLEGGFEILDVSNPAAPVSLGSMNYSGSFTHNIWPSGDGRYVCTTDEVCGSGHLRIWNVSDPTNIVQVSEYSVPNQGNTCVHNAMWVDDFIYMSYYTHGLRILDVTDPANPIEVGAYDTFTTVAAPDDGLVRGGTTTSHEGHEIGGGTCFDGAWGIWAERIGPDETRVLVSDISTGLWLFTYTGANNMNVEGVGLYDPSNGAFFLRDTPSVGNADTTFGFGVGGGATGLVGDWDGNGTKTPGLYVASTGTFFLKNTNAPGAADLAFSFGPTNSTLQPIVGDWDGNDTETIGLYNPGNGTFFLKNTNSPGAADLAFVFGVGGATAVTGDWDDTQTDTVGLYVGASGTFFLKNSNTSGNADLVFTFGGPSQGYVPISGDWNGIGADTVGVYQPANGSFFLRNSNTAGNADMVFFYGTGGWLPLAGDWKGPGL